MSLDALKALAKKKKEEKKELLGEDKKVFKKGELEAARLLKLRQEEEEERQRKELKRKQLEGQTEEPAAKAARKDEGADNDEIPVKLPREEVIRRLRALGQPATLFGEEDYDRLKRLVKAEKEVQVEEETRGGQQENLLLELQRQERHKKPKAKEAEEASRKAEASKAAAQQKAAQGPAAPATEGNAEQEQKDELYLAFERKAKEVAEQLAEQKLSREEYVLKYLARWIREWQDDLDKRPDAVKATATGYQATMLFEQTKKYLEALYDRLRRKTLHEELRTGLWMMVQAMRERNYLYANDIYLRLAIGNAPWPIGVTSVGIHERSAREKISHVMNASGQAHIMNDEATRKFLQAVKRLIAAVQRMYPTLPSRSVDFETHADLGRGVAGAGSTKLALLEAEAQGQLLEYAPAPHVLDADGKVAVPPKWEHILARQKQLLPGADLARSSSPGPVRTQSPAPGSARGVSPSPVKSTS